MVYRAIKHVSAGSYSASFRLLDENLLYSRRIVPRRKPSVERYSFGPYWSLHLGECPAGCFYIRNGKQMVELRGRRAVFLPPFSILELRLGPGVFEFESITSMARLPVFAPHSPVTFAPAEPSLPRNLEELSATLAHGSDWQPLALDLYAPAMVKRAKRRIDETFSESQSIFEVSKSLHVTHDVMARHFRRTYGFSPVAYRNKLRVTYSLWLLMARHYSVTDAGHAVGFHDLSGFNKQFKREAKIKPSDYRI